MTEYRITHVTKYAYTDAVSLCQNVAHLKPRDYSRQWCARTAVHVSPVPAVIEDRTDYFGNPATYFTVQEPHRALTISATHRIQVRPETPPEPHLTDAWERIRDQLPNDRTPEGLEAYQYVFDSCYAAASADFAKYGAASFPAHRPILEGVLELTARIHKDFVYDPRATNVATPLKDVFENRRGVCQDFAHLQIACLRSLGLPARYISGYLSTVPPPGRPRLVGADATHAWVSVFCGEYGWIDVDPTNNQIPADRHVLLAWGRDYDDVSPVKGVILGGGQHTVMVSVDVQPV